MIFSKNKPQRPDKLIDSIFGGIDADVFVVSADDCETLYMNERAQARLNPAIDVAGNCKTGFANAMPELCEHCSRLSNAPGKTDSFDITDEKRHIFSVTRTNATWMDGKAARIFMVRDVDAERTAKEKLYKLAYIDQLTGIPNRQKFREDFAAIEEEIDQKRVCGIIAMMDLDNFKSINDTYGHNAGDAMLKRLADHFESDDDFKGHVYRFGGDEFVMFYKDRVDKYKTRDDCYSHYYDILQKALLSYTMPNINDECTLSIGVAFYPEHGDTASELLRKADIALYQAKRAGRNRVALFEDKYDKAQKFKDIYISIQPILNRDGSTFGYELIDGTNDKPEGEESINLSEFNRTLSALGLTDIQSNAKYFISFTKQLLSKTVRRNLPKDKFVIQIHASMAHSDKEMQLYKQLHAYGYLLGLTGVNSGNLNRLLLDIVDYCKFDTGGMPAALQISLIAQNPNKLFIADGMTSKEELDIAQRRGYKLFQGYFFETPVVTKKTKDIDPIKANYLRLLQLTSTDDYVDFQEISSVIACDVALSYKLLKMLNSAAVGLRSKMSSIPMAVAYLGEENLKKWIALLALEGIVSDKPIELVRMSLIRARLGEILAPQMRPRRDARHVFLTGMLSLLHIALDKTKEDLLEEIPVADDIRESLLTKKGIYSDIVSFFGDYDYSNWAEIERFAQKYGISCDAINEAYIASVKWYNDLSK